MCSHSTSECQEDQIGGETACEKCLSTKHTEKSTTRPTGERTEECLSVGQDRKKSLATCVSRFSAKLDALRMEHFQICAVAVVTCFAGTQLLPLMTRSSQAEGASVPGVTNGMLHLGSFGANFGAQMWVSFVAGLTMFYSLPRHLFGKVQSRLFPMFYLWSLFFSAVTLSTFLERHPYDTWDSSLSVRAVILIVCFLTAAVNSLFVSRVIVSAMLQVFRKEVEAGMGDVIGHANSIELKKDPEYCRSYRTFRRFHGLSAMLVVTSMVCNVVYLYHIMSQGGVVL